MTTYTAIPDTNLEPGKPARSVDAILLRDNPIALAEGAAGAPRIQSDALDVDAVTAAIGRDVQAGDIGSYAFLMHTTNTDYGFGAIKAGSGLFPAAIAGAGSGVSPSYVATGVGISARGTALTGTWRCMGVAPYGDTSTDNILSLWVRIS